MFMPMTPQAPESSAPRKKPHAVIHPRPGTRPITRNRTTPTMAMVLYWRQR
jgi:hypothetical protein